jgi:hypothetical protein
MELFQAELATAKDVATYILKLVDSRAELVNVCIAGVIGYTFHKDADGQSESMTLNYIVLYRADSSVNSM